VEINGRRGRVGWRRNGGAKQSVGVGSGSKILETRVPAAFHTIRHCAEYPWLPDRALDQKTERVGGSSRHRHAGLVKLNKRASTDAGQMNLEVK